MLRSETVTAPEIWGEAISLPPVTVALLGASNLSRGYWALSHCLRANLRPRRARILSALGPGRGYVAPGGLGPLLYPPIRDSPVFSALKKYSRQGERTIAFLTDLGNDFLYNVTGEAFMTELEALFDRLEESNTKILVTPIHPVLTEILTPRVYKFLRTCLYPKSRVSFEQVILGIEAVNRFLQEAEGTGRITRLEGLDAFLGWDYIHYGWVQGAVAWSLVADSILSCIGQVPRVVISQSQMFTSYLENGIRLVGTDFLGWYPRRSCLF